MDWNMTCSLHRGCVIMCLGLSVLCFYCLHFGLPSSQGDVVAVAAPFWLNTFCAAPAPFYFCQPTDSLLPIMYSKRCFFTVWCLFSVPVVCAAVSRILDSCFFFFFCYYFFVSVCLMLSHSQVYVLSVVVRHQWGKCPSISVCGMQREWREC